jgi:hypothetical protein
MLETFALVSAVIDPIDADLRSDSVYGVQIPRVPLWGKRSRPLHGLPYLGIQAVSAHR